jgi:hypothetical protein
MHCEPKALGNISSIIVCSALTPPVGLLRDLAPDLSFPYIKTVFPPTLSLLFYPEDGAAYFFKLLESTRLLGATLQNTVTFIVIAVTSSNLIKKTAHSVPFFSLEITQQKSLSISNPVMDSQMEFLI